MSIEELQQMTKAEIMNYAKSRGAKPPGTLRKADLIAYLQKFEERSRMFENMRN